MFNTPILFLIFNRLETTKKVFAQIKKIRPAQLFIAADGPRNDIDGEKEKCEAVKNWVLSEVDWECELKTLFRDENLGCKYAVSGAINWFFEIVEEGIILEDDCLPHNSFFKYCEILLARYRNEDNVVHIGGNNFQRGIQRGNADYYFSKYNHIWGWATWRRAWKVYDVEMAEYRYDNCNRMLAEIFPTKAVRIYWLEIFNLANKGLIDTWDYQWTFAVWKNRGLSIVPQENLVANIGFGEGASHTLDKDSWMSNLKINYLEVQKHPDKIKVFKIADAYTSENVFKILTKVSWNYLTIKKKISDFLVGSGNR